MTRTSPDVAVVTRTSPDVAVVPRRSPDVAVLDYVPAAVPGTGARFDRDREEARARGYAEGWAAGQRDAAARAELLRGELEAGASAQAERWRERQVLALAAVESAARALHTREAPALDDVAATVLDAALELAEALLGRELATVHDVGLTALRRALDSVGAVRPLEVRLSPADVASLDGVALPDGVRLVADPALASGDAVAVHAGGSLDARIAAGLTRAREVLAP
jgi:flagellar assembly protein FliH